MTTREEQIAAQRKIIDKPTNQFHAKLRICASCEKVFWDRERGCPICGFGHYGAIWAVGWKKAILWWITKHHRYVKDEYRVDRE